MAESDLVFSPSRAQLGELTLAPVLETHKHGVWDVKLVLSRASGQAPLQASEVDAQLFSGADKAMAVTERPSGKLAEFGGGLGSSMNADFRFEEADVQPSRLVVKYAGHTASFAVAPGAHNPG